jgi:hypothetical protein
MEATEKIRPSGGHARKGFDLQLASSTEKAHALVREGHHRVAIPLIGQGPGGQRTRTKDPVFIVPHGVDCGSSGRCAPPRAGTELVHTVGECTTWPLSEIALGKGGQ